MPRLLKAFIIFVLFMASIAFAAKFDARVAAWVHAEGFKAVIHRDRWPLIAKIPGHYGYCTLPVAALVGLATRHRWRGAALVASSGIVAGLLYTVAKWCVGRTRPFPANGVAETPFTFHPFARGLAGLVKAENQAFPSGHACLAFATATALTMLLPRGWALFYLVAVLTAFERVMENAHYPSDVVAGAGFGILAAGITSWGLKRLWSDNKDHVSPAAFAVVPSDYVKT